MTQKSKHIFDLITGQGLVYGRVDVGWAVFDIKLVSGLKSGESTCWGTCDFDNYVISLEKKMEDAPARETLLHEICHIFLDSIFKRIHLEVLCHHQYHKKQHAVLSFPLVGPKTRFKTKPF